MKIRPLISVLMPVFNAETFVTLAVESILSQTYDNFELIIVDDASTDSSFAMLEKLAQKDKRITLLKNNAHQGINTCMNRAIAHATGSFYARMDADDIALPKRLEKQLRYLQKHTDLVAAGGNFFIINSDGQLMGKRAFPRDFSRIYPYSFYFVAISQPSMMIARKRLPKTFVYYDENTIWADDVELVFKLFLYGKVGNVKDTILLYRMHEDSHSLKNPKKTFYHTLKFRIKAMIDYNYRPSIKGIFVNLAQLFVITLLPNNIILHLYKKVRNEPLAKTQQELPQLVLKTALS